MIREYRLKSSDLGAFAPLIPEWYLDDLERGEIFAVGAFDTWADEVIGVLLCRDISGWMELVWVKFAEVYEGSDAAFDFLQRRIESVRNGGVLKGIFIDYPDEEMVTSCAWMLNVLDFRDYTVSDGIFELTTAEVKKAEILHRSISPNVRRLGAISDEAKKKLVKAIRADDRAIPLPRLVDWSIYDADISVAYMDKTDPKGLLLFTWTDDMLTFSCAWATEPRALVFMLISALAEFEKNAQDDARIIIPVLNEQTKSLVEKIVPGARMKEILEQRLYFDEVQEDWMPLE